jgi:hypothetical protein
LAVLGDQELLKTSKSQNSLKDNRKLIILNRLLDPVQDPQVILANPLSYLLKIKSALQIGRDFPKVQLARDILDYMMTKPAGNDEFKIKIETDLV